MPNKFFWYDVMTTDTNAGRAFYNDVVGWSAQPSPQPGMEYTVFMVNGQGTAGLPADTGGCTQRGRSPDVDGVHRR